MKEATQNPQKTKCLILSSNVSGQIPWARHCVWGSKDNSQGLFLGQLDLKRRLSKNEVGFFFFFYDFSFLLWTVFKVFTESVKVLFLFYVLVFGPQGTWDLCCPNRDRTHSPCNGSHSLNHWTAREVPVVGFL